MSFKVDQRFWLSSLDIYLNWIPAVHEYGGLDDMLAIGEPNSDSYAMGSQRPALQIMDQTSKHRFMCSTLCRGNEYGKHIFPFSFFALLIL